MADNSKLKAIVAANRAARKSRRFADGGGVSTGDVTSGTSDNDYAQALLTNQRAQQASVLPTERQPPLAGQIEPQSEALQRPEISPEEVLAGGLGNMAAEATTPAITGAARAVGKVAVPFAKRLATDEAGEVPLTKQSAQAWASLAKPPEAPPAAQVPIYSKLEQVANDKIRQQMPAEYAKATLKNAGVTQEEMDVYGVDDFLDSHPNVKPDEFKAHLEANRPDIQKHVYGLKPGAANGPYNARNLPEEYEPSDHDVEAAAEDDRDTFYDRLSEASSDSMAEDSDAPHRTLSIDSIQEDENGEPLEEPKYQVDFGRNDYRVGYGANRRTLSGLEEFDSEEKAQEAIDAAQEQWEESAREYHDDSNYSQVWDDHLDSTRDRLREEAAEKLNQEAATPPAPDAIPQEPIEGKPSYADYKLKGGTNYREELYTGPSKTALGQARNEQAFRAALDKTNWPESIGGKETAAPEMAQYIDQLRNSTKPEDKAAVAAYDKVVPQWVNSARAQMFANQKRIAELSEKLKEGGDDMITLSEIHQLRDKNNGLAETIAAKNPNYKGGHFGSTQPNIWAHARTTDRITDDGLNSLHVEEVQSDPHQEARELGYQGANPKPYSGPTFTQADADAHVQKMRGELQQYMKEKGLTDEPEALAQAQRDNLFKPEDLDKLEAISKYKAHQANPSGVPELIMSKSWDKNVFKRLLKRAVDQDKDALTWNTGEISASNNGTPKEKMGGQKLNYDVKYPAIIKKLVNEFDPSIKVEKMGLPDSDAPVWGIKLTPKLKQGLRSKGLPSFAEGGEIWDEANAAAQAIKSGQQPPTDHPATTAAAMNMAASSIAPPEGYGLPLSKAAGSDTVRQVAQDYMESKGLPAPTTPTLSRVDPQRGRSIAQAYDSMAHAPNDPRVRASYDALIKETGDQYQAIKSTGIKIEPIAPGENPYPNGSKDLVKDVHENNHLYYYPTDQGFGSGGSEFSDHPMLQETGEKIGDKPLLANDQFKIVHDYFGHAKEGNSFGPNGEEAAWQIHAPMYSPEARRAMTTETRGQNSWVNFGPKGEANRANPRNTTYAEQKAGLLPDWVSSEGSRTAPTQKELAAQTQKKGRELYQEDVAKGYKKKFAEGGGVQPGAQPQPAPGVNVISPEGEMGSLPHEQVLQALQAGYRLATPEETDDYFKQQEFGTPLEQAKTFGEGVGQGILGPAAPAIETGMGISTPERMRARQEVNPGSYYGGQFTGLTASTLAGVGVGSTVEAVGKAAIGSTAARKAGAFVAARIGSTAARFAGASVAARIGSTAARIGSTAARFAIENMVLQGSDEASKLVISQDPHLTNQAAQTALVNMGLSGLIGAGFGATLGVTKPIWDVAAQSKIGQMLNLMAAKTGGVAGVAPDEIRRAIQVSGLDVPPEVVAGMSKDPEIQHMFSSLMESSTKPGLSTQETLRIFRQRAGNAIINAMGSTPEDVAALGDLSAFDAGTALKKSLKAELKSGIDPIAEQFEAIKKQFSNLALPEQTASTMVTTLGQIHNTAGLHLDPQGPQAKLVQRAIDMVGNMKTLEDIRNAGSIVDDITKDPQLWRIGGQIKRVFRDTEDRVLDQQLAKASGPRLNLRGDDYSIMTAENPGAISQTPEQNDALMKQLYSELDQRGIPYHQTVGRYGPNPEAGVLIPHSPQVSKDTINEIAKKYGQESVLHRIGQENQLEFLNGPNAGKYKSGKGLDMKPDAFSDFTQVGNKKFHAHLGDDLHSPELVHYSAYDQPLSMINPEYHGTGVAGKEMSRGPGQVPKSYYYESHAIPEDMVTGRAKHVYHVARPNNIVDLNSDAGKAIIAEASKTSTNQTDALNTMEKLIRDKGFAGYKNTASQLPDAVALFHEQPVLRGRPMDASEFSEIRAREAAKALADKAKETGKSKTYDVIQDQLRDAAIGGETNQSDEDIKAKHRTARAAYAKTMNTIDSLNDRLHVGKYYGPGTFMSALGDMQPEDVLRRLSPKNDAGIIGELSQKFPNSAQTLKDYHVNQTLKAAADRAAPGEPLNINNFYKSLEKMSPEMRQFVVPQEATEKLNAIQQLLDALPTKMNNSGTAKTLDSLWSHMPASAVGMAAMMTEHSPLTGLLVGGITKALGRDIPDAARLGLLKFLGSSAPIDSSGFKSMVEFIDHSIKGENMLNNGVKNIFRAGSEVLPASQFPSENTRNRLDKSLQQYQNNPQGLMQAAKGTGHYMPDHAQALSQTAATAVAYLNSQRPGVERANPLDTPIKPSMIQRQDYQRTLDIAEQPLIALSRLQKGTLTAKDVITLKQLYPDLYQRVSQKLITNVMSMVSKGKPIPYGLRLQLSTFLGQPLDSTMTPMAIMNAQASSMKRQAAAQTPAPGKTKKGTSKLGGIAKGAQTQGQGREAARAGQTKD